MKIPGWILWSVILMVLALPVRFLLRGYNYIAYTLIFIAALIVLRHIAGEPLQRVIAVFLCIGFMYFCTVEFNIINNARSDLNNGRKYLIVLGAGVEGTRPSRSLLYRINAAYEYLTENPGSIAVLSGGQGANEDITEAQCMYNVLCERGISPERLIMEPNATSTSENLDFSFNLIRNLGDDPDGNTAIVTSSYHLYRAKSMAQRRGVTAAGVAAYPGWPLLALNFYIREAFGVTHLWVLGT